MKIVPEFEFLLNFPSSVRRYKAFNDKIKIFMCERLREWVNLITAYAGISSRRPGFILTAACERYVIDIGIFRYWNRL